MHRLGEYQNRLNHIDADLSAVYRRYSLQAYAAGLAVAAALLATYLAFVPRVLPRFTVVPFPLWFAYSMRRFRSAAIRGRELRSRRGFYERGVARLEQRWIGEGRSGEQYVQDGHLYAQDLDLFGEGSLFELLCTTPTAFGHRELAEWLQTPASRETAIDRQQAIAELSAEPELRAGLSVAGESFALQSDSEALRSWLRQPDRRISRRARAGLLLLTISLVLSAMLSLGGILAAPLSYVALGVLGTAQLAMGLLLRRRVTQLIQSVGLPSTAFNGLARVFEYLATPRAFSSPLLVRTCAAFAGSLPAPRALRALNRLTRTLDSRNSDQFLYASYLLLWGTHWSFAIEAWRVRNKEHFLLWLDALASLEALCAFATFAYERSEACYPELIDGEAGCLEAVGLRHPLLRQETSVGNDIRIDDATRLAVISGSHMSGKSTFLKAVGVAVVLAWAGAPVTAKRFRVSKVSLAASMKVGDSLHDRKSRFLTEAARIGKILELARAQRTVLYLFDEMLSGTNSHDRRIGAEAILGALVEAGAMGAITTHDLAITEIVQQIGERGRNVHFADSISEGQLHFDYRLRPGVVQTSNAIETLRSFGIQL
jgi:hypothetical protein